MPHDLAQAAITLIDLRARVLSVIAMLEQQSHITGWADVSQGWDSHKPQCVFAASYVLLDSGDLTKDERNQLREMTIWFNVNLPTPPKRFDSRRAVFWFKSIANENIRKIWELVQFLRQHGHHVEVHKCRRQGNIVWEDGYQAAAFPSELDGKITIQ